MMKGRGTLFVVSAPSGAGKSTLIKALMEKDGGVGFSVSHTTREPRAGEKDGAHYYFVSRDEFEKLAAQDSFVEWATVHGNLYGTSREALASVLDAGKDVILDIDVQGAEQVAAKVEGAVTIFILPPSVEELEIRLKNRNKDSVAVIERRVENALGEIESAGRYDYSIVNDVFDEALKNLECVIRAERLRNRR